MPSPASGLKTRQALIEAARDFLGEGNSDVTIQDIARAAEVSVGSVYTYFADKRELFEAAAAEAVLESTPELAQITGDWEDPGLGLMAAILFAMKRPQFAPKTARIILTVGPLGFARNTDYFESPKQALRASVEMGTAKCEDIPAFVMSLSGAYQNVLANIYAGTTDPDMPERVMWMFTEMLGYSRAEFQKVAGYVAAYQSRQG